MEGETYRKMLIDLSAEVTSDNLKSMKFLCSDFIAKRRLERVSDVTELWEALEEADKISKEDTSFVETLLVNACQNRGDLLALYRKYVNTSTQPFTRNTEAIKHDPNGTAT